MGANVALLAFPFLFFFFFFFFSFSSFVFLSSALLAQRR